jgi:Kef-type K+ transport system membrane component KefB
MKNNFLIKETTLAAVLLVLLFVLLNPFHWWMADMMLATLLILSLVVFGIFALFVVQEKTVDEREQQHRVMAGRTAFIAGTLVLTLAILSQSIHHHVDPWLFITFVVMVIAKLGTRAYIDRNY